MHLFNGVHYFISPSLTPQRAQELSHVLDTNSAASVDSIDDPALTHFITNSNRFERWQDLVTREEAGTLSVVTDKWVDKSMLLGKLQPESCYSADPAMIFSGVVACASELPSADLEVLSAGISALGGQWRTGLTKDVTHLFAISPSSAKYSTAFHFQEYTSIKVILPHWFDDSVRLGLGTLDTTPYEWPDPPLLRGPPDEKDKGKERQDAVKRAALRKLDAEKRTLYRTSELLAPDAPLPDTTGSQADASLSRTTKDVWQGRRVLLGRSLGLSASRREAVEAEVRRAGGVVVPCAGDRDEEALAVEDCDVFVARYRSGKAYVAAVRKAKTIGTLPWVFHVQSTGVLSPPMDQLLWYPIPRRPIEGFSAHEITVTNYTGESREYLKRLIAAMGATFTPSMSGKNTVLIAAYISGTKTTKAASWSIPIVNHTWLEDCFIKWRNLTVGTEKYIVFTPGMDFSLMLGERGVGRGVEEVGEEELEGLEREEEEEEEEREREREEEEARGKEREIVKLKKNGALLGTQTSARDAREVEEFVGAGMDVDGDGDEDGDGDGGGDVHMEAQQPDLHVEEDAPQDAMDVVDDGEDKDTHELPAEAEEEGEEEEEEHPPAPSKSTPAPAPTPTPRSTKSIAERIQEKGESTAKTRIKPRSKGRRPPERSATPEVYVTKRKSGQLEVTPVKKLKRPRAAEGSSSSDEVEVVEAVKGKGKGSRLVRRLGERSESWIMDAVVVTPLKGTTSKVAREGSDDDDKKDEDEVVVKQLKKRVLRKSPSKTVFSDDDDKGEDDDEEQVQDAVVVNQRKKPSGKRAISDSDDEVEEVVVKKGKRKSHPSSDEEQEDELPIRKKGREPAAASSLKAQAKAKPRPRMHSDEEDDLRLESEEDVAVVASTSKGKAKGKAVEVAKKVERSKPKPIGKGKKVVIEPPESEDEEDVPSPPKKASSSKLKRAHTPPASDEEEEEGDAMSPPIPKAKKSNAQISNKVEKVSKPRPPLSDEEEDEEDALSTPPPPPPPRKAKKPTTSAKPKGRQSAKSSVVVEPTPSVASPSKTPKRVVSVLLPELTLSTKKSPLKPKSKPAESAGSTPLARTESVRAAAGERASTSRPSAAIASGSTSKSSKAKPKAKPKPVPAPPAAASSPAPPTVGEDGDTSIMVTSGRQKRSAAAKATQKLREEIMPDVMNYQQEMRNAGKGRRSLGASINSLPPAAAAAGGGVGKKRQSVGADEDEEEGAEEGGREAKRRRLAAPGAKKKGKASVDEDSGEEEEKEEEEPAKLTKGKGKGKRKAVEEDVEDEEEVSTSKKGDGKTKKGVKAEDLNVSVGSKKPGAVRLMTTQVSLSEDVVKALTKLGVKFTTRPAECTHLLAPHLVRTEKLLCALANAAFILTEKWATDSAAAKKLLDEGKYLLHDEANEGKFDFVLADALARAKELHGSLFAKMVFYITPKVSIDIKLLKNVVTACGGQVNTQPPTLRILNASPGRYIVSCADDISIWRPISRAHPVYTHELILTSALKQEIDWDNKTYRVPGSES